MKKFVEYYIYLLPFRRIVCLIRGHKWHTFRQDGDDYNRVCLRCGVAGGYMTIDLEEVK